MLEQLLEPRYLWWLWDGFLVTLAISFFTIIFSTILGFLLVIAQQSRIKLIKGIVLGYNAIFRYSPLLPQLFFWYFGIGNLLPTEFKIWLFDEPQIQLWFFTLKMPSFEFIIGFIGLTCYSSAFIAEEFRAGIAGVSVGQQQASLALGLTWWQSMRFIILPQSFCIAFAPLIGQYMNIVKNSSLTMAIGVLELSYVSRQVETESLKTFQDFAIATFLYILAIVIIGTLGNIYQTKRFQTSKV
ncbi:amino acid ABC transporter permease [Gilliamella apicola]|uniref:amino acid ABC transporter permease n=1 Tax=Gilliamella apicola TaxID=1196095 RepID=UPI000A054CAE|nr:amino acid ABC transporter permease [Gilliamella apicola]ORF46009.1 amino acid ABC transporter permease [Gilliamella apicola]ORF49437.1 amino acid ABC transporter permease [Gilliamella apicola]ORF53280.1 amino acid ABC transporter permease [Gilliamella apicola]ORF55765.1 amino acid ABC transporter permease [Gilliamella apicola]ORF57199.1 amino acid ABC transporter permease [Gilliamella apicola]